MANAYKILLAGDQHDRAFFSSLAERITELDGDHTVYQLASCLDQSEKHEAANKKIVYYGIGKKDFEYDSSTSEFDNYHRLDEETLQAYFSNEKFLNDLKDEKFDLGVGGLNLADSALFRFLDVQYMKISEEDFESSAMQVKMGMPVVTSTYPSAQVISSYGFNDLPQNFASIDYRWPFFKQYQLNKFNLYQHTSSMAKLLPAQHRHLIADYDQDHALVVTQGATAGLFQAIMLKPPNVVNVYPLNSKRVEIQLPTEWSDAKSVAIFNIDAESKDDLMTSSEQQAMLRIQVQDLVQIKIPVVVIARGKHAKLMKTQFEGNSLVLVTEETNPKFLFNSIDTQAIWIGTCNQDNLLLSTEHNAVMFGYFHPESTTQKYTCHKLTLFGVGWPSKNGLENTKLPELINQISISKDSDGFNLIKDNVKFYRALLEQAGDRDKTDLLYWLDYLHEFGASHKVPRYDKMALLKWYNVDMVVMVLAWNYFWYKIICCLCCKKKQPVFGDDGKEKPQKKCCTCCCLCCGGEPKKTKTD